MALDDLPTLDIRVSRGPAGGYVVELQIGEREFPAGALGQDALSSETGDSEAGARLFAALVEDPRIRTAWEVAAGLHPRRRVRLRIDDAAPELHRLPWETLRDASPTSTAHALAADRDTPFSRHVSCAWEPLGPADERPLRVLTAVAAPRGLEAYDIPPIDRAREEQCLAEAMQAAPAGLVEHTTLRGPCTLAALEAELEGGYHVLHIVAHGVVRRGGGGGLAMFLEQPDGEIDRVEAARFAAMIERLRASLRLVVLMSCNTAARSATDASFGYAPALLAAGVPAVLAMQDRMPMIAGAAFTRAFYAELWSSGEIDRAANRARAVVLTERLPGSSIPVLYAARASLRLWPRTAAQQVSQQVAPAEEHVRKDIAGPDEADTWQAFGGPCRRLRVAREADGNLTVFALHPDGSLWQRRQLKAGGDWDEWVQIGEQIQEFDTVMDRRGRLSVVSVDPEGACWIMTQDAPYAAWGRPRRLGVTAKQITAVCRHDGRVVLCALDGDDIYVNEQREPGGGWGEWYCLTGGYERLVVVRNGFGQVVLFGVSDEPAIYYTVQRGPGGNWDDWAQIAEETADLSADQGPDGRLYLVCVDSEDSLWCLSEKRPGCDWGDWEDLKSKCKQAIGLFRSAGPYEIYGLDAEGAVWRRRRSKGEWDVWERLGGLGYVHLDVFEDAKGELEMFTVAESGRIYRWSRTAQRRL